MKDPLSDEALADAFAPVMIIGFVIVICTMIGNIVGSLVVHFICRFMP